MKLNREIYQVDPSTRKLINEGVASVNDERTREAMNVLRYELETFVCDGQYEKGMAHILEMFLKNINQAQQPGVWVSGFYGSGKSHLIKMLRALWTDTVFEDGATARGIANLPQGIQDLLRELSMAGKRHGGLHAASGTLGAGASGSVRLALLRIIFKSVGLPESYGAARFVMWLKDSGIYDSVRAHVEQRGIDWEDEIANLYVGEALHDALVHTRPSMFQSREACVQALSNQYPYVEDVSSSEMTRAIRQALTRDGKFPLTLVVLDEVQQYIGESSQRSREVEEAVEPACKDFAGKLMFIGSGQTAVTGTTNLRKLEGRFTVRVELSDTDVDTVIRKVILAKKPEAKPDLEAVLQRNIGEVSRHLAGTSIRHRQDDLPHFSQDYPILPVRRRFWENTLRALDQTGTDSQLRNQLSLVHKVVQTNLDAPLGRMVPADYLYFDSAEKLLQSRLLPRKVYDHSLKWLKGTPDEKLIARALGLVFLINKLNAKNNEIGIRATIDTLADLLVEDLTAGSAALRSRLPGILDGCELLMKVGDEYRIKTEESTAWDDEFMNQRSILANESHLVDVEREDRIRKTFADEVGRLVLQQGTSKVSRDVYPLFEANLPPDQDKKVYIWVRDGWSTDESSVRADARQAGNESPTVFVFIPKRNSDDLRHHLFDYKACVNTLNQRSQSDTPESKEARAAMTTKRDTAEGRIRSLLGEAFSGARVFQAGGNEILGNTLQASVIEACESALKRLYPDFHPADHTGWAKVYERAQKGAPDALKAVGYEGEPSNHPVCKTVLAFIAGGKKGNEVRSHFQAPPYGWGQDAVDGALQVLLVASLLRAQDERGKPVPATDLERRAIGKTEYRIEATLITAPQRQRIRALFQKMGLRSTRPDEDVKVAIQCVAKLLELADEAGGEAPKPEAPETSALGEMRLLAGNELLLALFNRADELSEAFDAWTDIAGRINSRWPQWTQLKQLAAHAGSLEDADLLRAQVDSIEQHRLLLDEPNPVTPLVNSLTQMLRDELNRLDAAYETERGQGAKRLEADSNWQKLEPEQRHGLLQKQHLHDAARPKVDVTSTAGVLATLHKLSLTGFADRVAAMPGRFDSVLAEAAMLCLPEAQILRLPGRTLTSIVDLDAWLGEIRQKLESALTRGPVVIQ